jgi:hypothetical protein
MITLGKKRSSSQLNSSIPLEVIVLETGFFQKLKSRLENWFKKPERFQLPTKKHFQIDAITNEPASMTPPASSLSAEEPGLVSLPGTNVLQFPQPGPQDSQDPPVPGGFRVDASSRPKVCPVCRTANQITRLPSNAWKCEACQHTWSVRN